MDTVLIVDDHSDTAESLEMLLKLEGFETRTYTHYEPALEEVSHNGSCLVFADLKVPGKLTVDEFVRRARQSRPTIKIVVASGCSDIAQRAAQMAADDYLLKPYDPNRVLDIVSRFCRRPETAV